MTGSLRAPALLLCGVLALTALLLAHRAARRRATAADFYAGGRLLSPPANGLALAGGPLSAVCFVGVTGLTALGGHDGVFYAAGLLLGWVVALLLVAEGVRNCGRHTPADVVVSRLRDRRVRAAAGVAAVTVSVLCLVAQLAAAGSLAAPLFGGGAVARTGTVLAGGALMVACACRGGMQAVTRIQLVHVVLLLGCAGVLCGLVLLRYGGDPAALLRAAAGRATAGAATAVPEATEQGGWAVPGPAYGEGTAERLDAVSLGLALVLGTAGLPHVLARCGTVPTAPAARRSVGWAIGLLGCVCLLTLGLGLGAAALLGPETVREAGPAGHAAVPLLAAELGGEAGTGGAVLAVVVSAVALAAILAVGAGMTLAGAAAVARDLHTPRGGRPGRGEVRVARTMTLAVAVPALALALPAQRLNAALLLGLALAVAASALLPALSYALFWHRFTARGALWALWGGLVPAVLLIAVSPVVSGGEHALLPGADVAVFPLGNPGLVSIPLGFLAGWLGTVTSRAPADPVRYAETEVRALTGAGAV